MVVALITALGTVIVALVAIIGTRVESRDARSQLTKDVEILLKLGPTSEARSTLDRHVSDSAWRLATSETKRWRLRRARSFMYMGTALGIVSIACRIAIGGDQGTPAAYLRSMAATGSEMFQVLSLVTFVLCFYAMYRDIRDPKPTVNDNGVKPQSPNTDERDENAR